MAFQRKKPAAIGTKAPFPGFKAALLSKELGAPVKGQWTEKTTSITASSLPSRSSASRTRTALALSLLAGALLLNAQAASAQANPPRATTTQPAKNPPEQSSMPSNAPPATTTQTMGETSRDPMVKKMNEDEKAKVETKGK